MELVKRTLTSTEHAFLLFDPVALADSKTAGNSLRIDIANVTSCGNTFAYLSSTEHPIDVLVVMDKDEDMPCYIPPAESSITNGYLYVPSGTLRLCALEDAESEACDSVTAVAPGHYHLKAYESFSSDAFAWQLPQSTTMKCYMRTLTAEEERELGIQSTGNPLVLGCLFTIFSLVLAPIWVCNSLPKPVLAIATMAAISLVTFIAGIVLTPRQSKNQSTRNTAEAGTSQVETPRNNPPQIMVFLNKTDAAPEVFDQGLLGRRT